MPSSRTRTAVGSSVRDTRDENARGFVVWLIETGYQVAAVALTVIAAGIAAYAFTLSVGDGARSVIFFVIPAMWGAYALAANDGQPEALEKIAEPAVVGLATASALVLSGVLFLGAPVAIANLALGVMIAFFFLMWISNAPSRYRRRLSSLGKLWGKALLVMITVLGIVTAVAL